MNENKCENCQKNNWKHQRCNGDERTHHHGAVHTRGDQLLRLCDECHQIDLENWNIYKGKKVNPPEVF